VCGTSLMAAERAASESGPVRREGVTSSVPPLAFASAASLAPKVAASSGGKLKAWLSPPSRTVMRGCGSAVLGGGGGHAPPADGDDEPWPGRFERLVGGDGTKEASRRHMDLQPR